MFTTAEKSKIPSTSVQRKQREASFFRKAGDESFFSGKESSFFSSTIQTKLNVSSPDDPQEKEADAVADQVMRMPEPVASVPSKDEEKVQSKEDKEEKLQAQFQTPTIHIQRACADCADEKAQPKVFRMIQRSEDNTGSYADDVTTDSSSDYNVNRKALSLHHADVVQRSGRGPPNEVSSDSFEQNLSASKGIGSSLPSDTRQFMESRFGADFSNVRIHTGSYAENLSSGIHAQAFAHGNDLYFNSGKYSPHTEAGGTLLAHELTHTIQQGASPSQSSGSVATKSISRNIIQRSSAGVPSQLTNAVEKAKTVEGKIDANKPQADGYRTGWEHLVEIFKSAFGEDMIISGSGSAVQGAVAEQDIKKKREQSGLTIVDKTTVTSKNAIPKTTSGSRDAMPSWCGIFTFWALNKSGVPMPKWKLGERMIKLESARAPGSQPLPGDIAYRNAYSHFAIVESVNGGTVRTVNGNTAGEDNLGGQVQTIDHPLSDWTAFFNPLQNMEGTLGTGEGNDVTPVRSLSELRKELFNVQRKDDTGVSNEEKEVQAKSNDTILSATQIGSSSESTDHSVTSSASSRPTVCNLDLSKDDTTEKEQEQALSSASGQFDIHRSFDNNKHPVTETGLSPQQDKSLPADTPAIINRKEIIRTSTSSNNLQRQSILVNGRGPPRSPPLIQAMLNRKMIQRSWLGDAWDAVSGFASEAAQWVERGLNAAKRWLLEKVRDFVSIIPGYSMLCLILGEDPITGEARPLTGENLLNAGLDCLLGVGSMFRQLLIRLGIFNDVAAWLQGRIGDVSSLASGIANRFAQFWDRLSITDVGDPEGVMNRVAELLRSTINDIVGFATRSAVTFLEMIKRVMIREIAAFVRNRTPRLFPLLTVALGFNPETMEPVERNGTNILNALLEVSEEGREQRKQMMETGTFQRIVGWIDRGIAVFSTAYHQLIQAFRNIWNYVTIDNLFHPIDTFTRIWNEFSAPVRLVGQFLLDAAIEILKVIKDALLGRLSAYARQTRGFTLICVIIGRDPFTGTIVPRTVHNLVKGFMSLMDGGEQQYEQLKESGAIDRIVNKVLAAVERLNMTPQAIIQLFIDLWNNVFTLETLRHPIQAFQRIVATFAAPILRLIRFVIEIVMIVVEAILILMNFPFDLINNIIAKARLAWDMIKRDPVAFFKNLLKAIKQGFIQFFDNILTHLWNGLKKWFLSEVQAAGIPIPTDFTLMGILKWLLVVLDITMEKIWKKLEERIGREKVARIRSIIDRVEQIANTAGEVYEFIQDVQRRGFVEVIIDKIKEKISNAWDMVMEAAKGFIMDQIISKVTAKLLSMLDPTGIMAVVNSAIALYKAIQSFIRYLRQMLEIVNSFVEGLVEIASGNIASAANFVENSLARGVPIAIGFLANQVGLNLSERLKDVVELVREKVDQGLTFVIDRLVTIVERLVSMGRSAARTVMGWLGIRKAFTLPNGEDHEIYFTGSEQNPRVMVASNVPKSIEELVSSRRNATTAPQLTSVQNNALTQALTKKGELDNFISTSRTSNAGGGSSTNSLQAGIETRLDSIKQDLITGDAIPASPDLPLSAVTYAMDGNRAKSVTAKPLSKRSGNTSGSPPVQVDTVPPGWHHIRAMEGARITGWVKAHLLNENLHGPGQNWNLVPASQRFNSAMRVGSEKWAKDQVANDEIIHYKAEVTSWHTDNSNPLVQNFFPTTVTVTYGYMPNPAKGRTAETVEGNIPYTNDEPPSGVAPGPPSINTMTREMIRTTFSGVGNVDRIYDVRNTLPNSSFRDLAHMYLRLRDAYNMSPQFENTFWPIISNKYNFENAFKF